jgi:hypothetical protein
MEENAVLVGIRDGAVLHLWACNQSTSAVQAFHTTATMGVALSA